MKDQKHIKKNLGWATADILIQGNLSAEISTTKHDKGYLLYSVRFSRVLKNGNKSSHFRPNDLMNLMDLITQSRHWIDADRDERNKQRSKRAPNQRR